MRPSQLAAATRPKKKPRHARERCRGWLPAIPYHKDYHMTVTRRRAKRYGYHPGTFPLLEYDNRLPLAYPAPRGDWRVRHVERRFGASRVEARLFLDTTEGSR